ncbi:hypothetical protein [Arenibacter palladensis]|uniref:hypothetical protein n=1 Tax=Arenibacter palladensis TaxID=237373 RepID=UPI0026E283C1|nr:hypothetical protein [Arenibacter palladensis]MDO6605285.1 hypothetical protein [Arenibacter palladensis]
MLIELDTIFKDFYGSFVDHFHSKEKNYDIYSHTYAGYIRISCQWIGNTKDSPIKNILEIKCTGYGPKEVKGSMNIIIDQLFLDKIGLDTLNVDSLNLTINNLIIVQKSIVSNNSEFKNISLLLDNCQVPELSIAGNFTEVKFNNNRININSFECNCSSLDISSNQPNKVREKSDINIFGKCPNSINIVNNKFYDSIGIFSESCKEINIEQNEFKHLEYCHSSFENLKISYNKIINMALQDLSPIHSEGYSSIFLIGNLDLACLTLDKLDFERTFWKLEPKTLSLKQVAKSSLTLVDNSIKTIKLHDVSWNYKSINNKKAHSGYHKKETLIKLKSEYSKQQDNYHERLFKSYEKRWYHDNKPSFPLFLSWYSNEFGLSLLRPFIWLFLLVVLESILIITINLDCAQLYFEQFGNFFYLLNPAHRTEIFLEIIEKTTCDTNRSVNSIIIVDNFFRILIGYTLFQFINAFRYKYDLR